MRKRWAEALKGFGADSTCRRHTQQRRLASHSLRENAAAATKALKHVGYLVRPKPREKLMRYGMMRKGRCLRTT